MSSIFLAVTMPRSRRPGDRRRAAGIFHVDGNRWPAREGAAGQCTGGDQYLRTVPNRSDGDVLSYRVANQIENHMAEA